MDSLRFVKSHYPYMRSAEENDLIWKNEAGSIEIRLERQPENGRPALDRTTLGCGAQASPPGLLLRLRFCGADHLVVDRRQQAILIFVQVRLENPRIALEVLEHSIFPL